MEEGNKRQKKLYQRWWVWVIGIILIIFVWNKVSDAIDKAATKEIPNVMSINYTDAEKVLDENGFDVTSIETEASSVLSNDINNRSVKKGEVFKINNSTSPNFYSTTKDKKVTIYYALNDYTFEAPAATEAPTAAPTAANEPEVSETSSNTEAWRQFLADYEAWTNTYVDFMKKYKENPTDISLISDYSKFAQETVEWAEKARQYEDELENASPEILGEYIETLGRITQKIAEIAL